MNDHTDPTIRLEALGHMTQETEAANPSQEDQQQAAAAQSKAAETDAAAKAWGMMMYTIGGFCQMIAPELKPVYSEDRCFQWGQQANAVAEKYGWNGPSALPELALIASTAGFAVPTFFLMKARIKAAQGEPGPASWVAKMGLWWRTRKARANAANATPQGVGGEVGSEQ